MRRRPITARALLGLTCAGALAAGLASAPVAAARSAADPGVLVGSWQRAITQPDIDRTASFREEPKGWSPPAPGPQTLVVANGSFTVFDKTGFSVAQTTRVDSGGAFDVLAYIRPDKGAFCPQWIPQNASYTWTIDGTDLVLTASADRCADRDSILAGRWTPAPRTRSLLARVTSAKDGKSFTWSAQLSEGGTKIGKDTGTCKFAGTSTKRATCRATLRLMDGTIVARGTVADLSKPFKLAIASGTGAYEGAGGTLLTKPAGKTKSLITLKLA